MKKVILISALVVVGTWIYNLSAITLNDIPNESAFPNAKAIINGNNAVLNTNINAIASSVTSSNIMQYGYNVMNGPSTNGAGQVWMVQAGTNSTAGTVQTNTFSPVFIATPFVVYQAYSGVMTQVLAVATNQFTTTGAGQNGSWMATGRIK